MNNKAAPSVGRGRGRRGGKENVVSAAPWSRTKEVTSTKSPNKMIDMATKYSNILENYESSSSEDDLHDDEIMDKTIKKYNEALEGEEDSQGNQILQEVLQSGAICCLVCIESVKRLNAIWSCTKCFSIFHLQCIQKWAREGIGRQSINTEGDLKGLEFSWNCPKCRHEYGQKECPTKYHCFCGKEEDPPFDPWTVPHSCGNRCERLLQPKCGHECLLLCHPGACPPCPKTVKSKCHCGKSNAMLKRCSKKYWSCANTCNHPLACGHHNCQELCHSGECPTCPNTSSQPCMCGKETTVRKCAEKEWNCKQTCDKALDCGHHVCEEECHQSACGECPRSGQRNCPCGKTEMILPCTEDINPCEDTCLKPLSCNLHKCSKRCHYGACDTCLQVVEKKCRCGRKKKEVPCSQNLQCEIKCTQTRSCGRHPCKKKCCDGKCPPCEQVCNRTLNCRNHKCPSPCHQGMCYPCPLTSKVSCFCGTNSIATPCGKERSVKPPRCKSYCNVPTDCHHETRKSHRCHFGLCPACQYVCDKELSYCHHTCPDVCHGHVRDKHAENQNLLRGLNNKKGSNLVFVSLPCQPCKTPVGKLCLGEHSITEFPCSELKAYSCSEECGRMLSCENHRCMKKCHTVKGKPDKEKAGSNCSSCEEMCRNPRPNNCIHDCKLPCHPGACPECNVHLKINCHCKTIKVYLKCSEYNGVNQDSQNELLCCKARCPKLLDCGHSCSKLCHKGACAQSSQCVDKKKVKCACGRKKKDFPCCDVINGVANLECDERCIEVKDKKHKVQHDQEESEKSALLKQQKEEVEKFERKKQGRKRKIRQVSEVEDEKSFIQRYKLRIFVFSFIIVGVAGIAATFYFDS